MAVNFQTDSSLSGLAKQVCKLMYSMENFISLQKSVFAVKKWIRFFVSEENAIVHRLSSCSADYIKNSRSSWRWGFRGVVREIHYVTGKIHA